MHEGDLAGLCGSRRQPECSFKQPRSFVKGRHSAVRRGRFLQCPANTLLCHSSLAGVGCRWSEFLPRSTKGEMSLVPPVPLYRRPNSAHHCFLWQVLSSVCFPLPTRPGVGSITYLPGAANGTPFVVASAADVNYSKLERNTTSARLRELTYPIQPNPQRTRSISHCACRPEVYSTTHLFTTFTLVIKGAPTPQSRPAHSLPPHQPNSSRAIAS